MQYWWDTEHSGKVYMVIGNVWVSGNLSYHLKDRPKWVDFRKRTGYVNAIYLCNTDNKCFRFNY